MNKQKKLLIQRNIFVFILIIIFGIIITQEKAGEIFLPKAEEKLKEYIETTYPDEKSTWKIGKTYYEKRSFKKKVASKENKHHFFYLIYKNKKINDSYKEDYLKGKNLLEYTEKKIQKDIKRITNDSIKITIPNTLDKYTDTVKNRIIKEDNIISLKIYTIEKEINIDNWQSTEILKQIEQTISSYNTNNITPKNYCLTITNSNNITESIKISNITEELSINPNKLDIINAIINQEDNIYLKNSKINYEYLN